MELAPPARRVRVCRDYILVILLLAPRGAPRAPWRVAMGAEIFQSSDTHRTRRETRAAARATPDRDTRHITR